MVLAGVLLGLLGAVLLQREGMHMPEPTPSVTATPTAEPSPVPPSPTPVPTPEADPAVTAALDAFLRDRPGRWSLYFAPLPEGEPVYRAADRNPMVSASLIKLYIMGAVYERTERGTLDHETVYPLLYDMITVSDNAAANELIRLLGGGEAETGMGLVNDWCSRQGYLETRLNRLMLEENGLQNYTTAQDCGELLSAIYRGGCVSPAASEEMLSLLLQQTVNDRLPAGLPAGTPVAHKTGELIGLCWADAGIVYSPGGTYLLCLISDGTAGEGEAKTAMADLSRQIYEIMNP